jgi:hypothetical protein
MAKTRTPRKLVAKKLTKVEEPKSVLTVPKAVHEVLGIVEPYDPPPEPIPTKGYVTGWDPGMSVNTLAKKHRDLFYIPKLFEGERCAKDTDLWKCRQWRIEPIAAGEPFEEHRKQLKTGDEPATVREIVLYIALHFLTTGERLDLGRLRTKDVAASGQRMTVWFSPMGFDIASVFDAWKSSGYRPERDESAGGEAEAEVTPRPRPQGAIPRPSGSPTPAPRCCAVPGPPPAPPAVPRRAPRAGRRCCRVPRRETRRGRRRKTSVGRGPR